MPSICGARGRAAPQECRGRTALPAGARRRPLRVLEGDVAQCAAASRCARSSMLDAELHEATCDRTTAHAPNKWSERGAGVGARGTRGLSWVGSTTCTTDGAKARSAARPSIDPLPIDGTSARRRVSVPKFCMKGFSARRALDKPIAVPHGPRPRPCGTRIRSASRGRTAEEFVQNTGYYTNVRSVVPTGSSQLQPIDDDPGHRNS